MSKLKRHAKGSAQAFVYNSLRERILTLDLEPNYPLDEKSLSSEYAVSRSPVREALIKLAADGLVVSLVNKVTVVAPLDLQRLPAYLEALELFHRVINRSAAIFRTDEDIKHIIRAEKKCDQASASSDLSGLAEWNRSYHLAIAKAAKNPYFESFYSQLLDEGIRTLHMYFRYRLEKSGRNLTEEHPAITRAIIDRDRIEAERLGRNHARLFNNEFQTYAFNRIVAADIDLGTAQDFSADATTMISRG